ncbi:MAG: hypothetical protein ABIK83_15170 [Candidatus Zixiibacteriota bacterium]
MKRTLVAAALYMLLLQSTVLGFDGLRKGFVVGGGLGVAATAKWSVDIPTNMISNIPGGATDESNVGVGGHFLIGYAWDEYNMIVYEGNGCAYTSDVFNDETSDDLNGKSAQSFGGATWYHYFGPLGKSFFSVVGVGAFAWKVKGYEMNDPGIAYIVGGGYEFAKHFQAGVYLSGGKTSDKITLPDGQTENIDFGHMHVNILVTAVAY